MVIHDYNDLYTVAYRGRHSTSSTSISLYPIILLGHIHPLLLLLHLIHESSEAFPFSSCLAPPIYPQSLLCTCSYHLSCASLTLSCVFVLLSVTTLDAACLIYKAIPGLAPPPISDFIKQKSSSVVWSRLTRATIRGDCELAFRWTTFSQMLCHIRE